MYEYLCKQEHGYLKSLLFVYLISHHIYLFEAEPHMNVIWLDIFKHLQMMKLCIFPYLLPLIGHMIGPLLASTSERTMPSHDTTTRCLSAHILSQLIGCNMFPLQNPPFLSIWYCKPNLCSRVISGPVDISSAVNTNMNTNMNINTNTGDAINEEKKQTSDDNKLYEPTNWHELLSSNSLLMNAIYERYKHRLEQKWTVLLRRLRVVLPFFQVDTRDTMAGDVENSSGSSIAATYGNSALLKLLRGAIDQLTNMGFDCRGMSESEAMALNAGGIKMAGLLNENPLSLFQLIPRDFVHLHSKEWMQPIEFMFNYHPSLEDHINTMVASHYQTNNK
ncbi:hypothetical protein RFI_13912 [Reticulomyxa filosa]|uniref:Uncharacterized protein n=1 Tax=Reticulomyxa filosa TaxID=46433 RepID=X6NAE6_RETFI|nr:hypothetical protein RFI_13912 [Reticulomyxa filosa]|eukprot:ETO23270.1 hypothetical protein RFI_13912 [Reticulomyxa filosa]